MQYYMYVRFSNFLFEIICWSCDLQPMASISPIMCMIYFKLSKVCNN